MCVCVHTPVPGLGFGEAAHVQDVEHEVSTADVLHHKEQVLLSLETGVEGCEEWGFPLQCQDLPLVQCTLHVIFLNYQVFLQTLDSVDLLRALVLGQEHLMCVLCVSV